MGIPIRIHFTFFLILVWLGFVAQQDGRGFVPGVVFGLLLFGCVVLHELGHATMAARFGVKTKDIVLYPIGGVARLSRIPSGKAELLIALAGPAVNVVLAILLFWITIALGSLAVVQNQPFEAATSGVVPSLLIANVFLFVFNLLPAFPMDGGRVLRALLSFRLPEDRATAIAARIGQVVAVGMAVVGLAGGQPGLLLIAFFVFFGASQEAAFTRGRAAVRGRTVRDAMVTRFDVLAPQETLGRASELLLGTHQHDFPVVDAWGRVAGLLTRPALFDALARLGPEAPVFEAMAREVAAVPPGLDLEIVLEGLSSRAGTLLVVDEGKLVGMLTLENLGELIELARRVPATPPKNP